MSNERIVKLAKYAALGVEPPDLQESEMETWKRIVAETAADRERGIMPDLPYE